MTPLPLAWALVNHTGADIAWGTDGPRDCAPATASLERSLPTSPRATASLPSKGIRDSALDPSAACMAAGMSAADARTICDVAA